MDESIEHRAQSLAAWLKDIDETVYAWVLRQHSLRVDVAAAELGLPEKEIRASFQRLIEAKLIRRSPDEPTAGFAVGPDVALAALSAPLKARIREDQRQLSLLQQELDRFTAPFHEAGRAASHSIEIIDSLPAVRASLNLASERCQREMITCQPGGGARVPEAMQEAIHRDRRLLERGISIRTLYHHTARFNAPSQGYVAFASALGAQYRTTYALFGRLIAFDRHTAYVPLQDNAWGAAVIREPNAVGYLCDIFELTWEMATPFADAASQGLEQVSRETHGTIIRLLASGLKDETIARRLGMSLRTARRHIAEILEGLNATSRFQAGAAAALKGLLIPPAEIHKTPPPARQNCVEMGDNEEPSSLLTQE